MFDDPARIDQRLDSRSISFENLTGARGSGGTAAHGRKGAPSRVLKPGETVRLADIEGPGRVTHIWATFRASQPERMRSLVLEVFYDGLEAPSISTPFLDFFGLPHGRTAPYASALTAAQEGRGFNAYYPMPFRRRLLMELTPTRSPSITRSTSPSARRRRTRVISTSASGGRTRLFRRTISSSLRV